MNWKRFLKPDLRKIVLFALFSVTIFSTWPTFGVTLTGFPLVVVNGVFVKSFSIPSLIIDLIFWYLVSCLIFWTYDRLTKKKEDYVHLKDVNMAMGQLEKWGKKKKK